MKITNCHVINFILVVFLILGSYYLGQSNMRLANSEYELGYVSGIATFHRLNERLAVYEMLKDDEITKTISLLETLISGDLELISYQGLYYQASGKELCNLLKSVDSENLDVIGNKLSKDIAAACG